MVVMGEVVVVVTMHVVAMPIITVITVPRGATMPAISIQSTHTGDLSAAYVTAAKMAHVSADVADVGCTDVASATVGASIGVLYHCGSKKKAARNSGNCNYVCFHDSISWVGSPKRSPAYRLCLCKHASRAKSLLAGKNFQFFSTAAQALFAAIAMHRRAPEPNQPALSVRLIRWPFNPRMSAYGT